MSDKLYIRHGSHEERMYAEEYRRRIADLEAENARLREAMATGMDIAGFVTKEVEDERDRYKARAERRGEALKLADEFLWDNVKGGYVCAIGGCENGVREHDDVCPLAIAATPDEEREKD